MEGTADAPAAGTILNALATGRGSAFAIGDRISATVTLDKCDEIEGRIEGVSVDDTTLIERCAQRVIDRFGSGQGATIVTKTDVAPAAGLKSSSAAANATVLATLSALGVPLAEETDQEMTIHHESTAEPRNPTITREAAARIGVQAARETGVSVTGAFDDAAASMLGGVVITDNDTDTLIEHTSIQRTVLVWSPPERSKSADAAVDRCRRLTSVASLIEELAHAGDYGRAMTINGFAFCAGLSYSTEPIVEALPAADGATLSGTGPSYVAIGDRESLSTVRATWAQRGGETWLTTTDVDGAIIR